MHDDRQLMIWSFFFFCTLKQFDLHLIGVAPPKMQRSDHDEIVATPKVSSDYLESL